MNVFYKLGRLYFNSIDKFNVVVEEKKEEIQLDDNQLVEDNKEVNDLIELILQIYLKNIQLEVEVRLDYECDYIYVKELLK